MTSPYILYDLQEEIAKYTHAAAIAEALHESNAQASEKQQDNMNNKHATRDEFRKMLIEKLNIHVLQATDLEIGVFNATIDYASNAKIQLSWKCQTFMETYINIARSIYANLKQDSYVGNRDLMQRMESKQFLPHMLSYMMCQDIFPERWKQIVEKNQQRIKAAYEIKKVAMTDQIQCSRCKGKKISYYELQTRSGDEAMTQFMECLICGKRWKM